MNNKISLQAHVQKVSEYDHNFSLGKLYVSSRVFNALHRGYLNFWNEYAIYFIE